MKILIIYNCSNGENCHCHRREWEETDIEYCDGDAKEFIEQKKKETEKNYRDNCARRIYGGRFEIVAAYVILEELEV